MSASTCGMVAFFRVSNIKFLPEVCFASSEVILQEDVYDKNPSILSCIFKIALKIFVDA